MFGGCYILQSLLNGYADPIRSAKLFVDISPFLIDTTSKVVLLVLEKFTALIENEASIPLELMTETQRW